jgi:hypothetical protein
VTIPDRRPDPEPRPRPIPWFLAWVLVSIWYMALAPGPAAAVQPPGPAMKTNQWEFDSQTGSRIPEFWKPLTGKWELVAEPEHPANQVLRQSETGPKLAVLASRSPLTNFEFSVRLRTDTFGHASRNWQMGFVFRRQDSERYYKLRISAANLALIRLTPPRTGSVPSSEGHTRTASAERAKPEGQLLVFTPLALPKDSWHTLGVRCLGEIMTVSFDGKELQTVTDPGVGSGLIGVYCNNTAAMFDDLRLTVRPVPKFSGRLTLEPGVFTPFRGGVVLIYYRLDQDGPVTMRVLDPSGALFNPLTKEVHSRGLNSLTWDGQGLTTMSPAPGTYTVEMQADGRTERAQVRVQAGAAGGSK